MASNPHRVQLRRTKGWRMPPNTVSVARPTVHGNPYRVGDLDPVTKKVVTPEMAVDLHRFLIKQTAFESLFGPRIASLRGKNLACWCALDAPCHADLLLELANQ